MPHQPRHFHTGLDEAENIIDQQQHIAVFIVAEIFRHCQGSVAHTKTAAWRFVHLAEHHHHVRQDACIFHFTIEFFAFAAAFANAAENTDTFLMPDHVVDHLGQQHCLAHARTAEQASFATAFQRRQHIDDLYAGFKYFGFGGASCQCGWRIVHAAPFDAGKCGLTVDDIAKHVEHAREYRLSDRGF